jgi:hypothetical protein
MKIHEKEKAIFLVITTSRPAKKLKDSFKLTCSCLVMKTNKSLSLNEIFAPIDEILFTSSFAKNYNISLVKRIVFLCKLMLKRPKLLIRTLFFAEIFELVCKNNCQEHSILHEGNTKVWYATSAARQGFPWPYDSFLNSLRFIREKEIDIMLFGLNTKSLLSSSENSRLSPDISLDNLFMASPEITRSVHEVYKWNKTKLQIVSDAEIIHGTILAKNDHFILQDLDLSLSEIPKSMTPNHLWFKEYSSDSIVLSTPKANLNIIEIDSCVFVNSVTDNFYHYVSESIRVLVMAFEANVRVDAIVIRADLPNQFYELIQNIYPNVLIIKASKNQKIKARNILFTQSYGRLSLEKSLFRGMPLQLIQESDEWLIWSWLRKRFIINQKPELLLYLPRDKYESRGILNSGILGDKLARHNFEILDTKKSSFRNQLTKFQNSKILCSTTGASLMNMIFAPIGATILEITYPSNDSWKFLAKLCELNYVNVPIKSILPNALNESLDVYIAPVFGLLNKIQELNS